MINEHAIHFNRSEDGRSFHVKDVDTFAKDVLPQYFKHSNFSSFVRQLNFYGFTKAKDIKLTNESSDASKYWEFRHGDFIRDDPHLLVKIVRRTSTSTGSGQNQKGKCGTASKGPQSANEGSDNELEEMEMKKEIQSLKGTICSMENEIKKLSDVLASITIDDTSKVKHKNKIQRVHHDRAPPIKKEATDERFNWPNKKRILLKDSELFESTSSDVTSARSHPAAVKVGAPKAQTTFAVSKHAASTDLPDLSLAIGDADLLLDDQQQSAPTANSMNRRTFNSSRRGSLSSSSGDEPLPMNTSHPDASGVLAEVDQMISSLESDATSSAQVSLASTAQDNSHNFSSQEPLPAIVPDEGNDDTSSQASLTSISLSALNDQHDEESARQPMRGRNLLDQNHIMNLEKCLASLPTPERIKFVQGIMNGIGGLDDLIQQGLTIVAKTPDNESAKKSENGLSSLSRARQVVESGMDTSLLSELESLLFRVGLRIQIVPTKSSAGRQPSPVGSSKLVRRSNSNSRKKNRVEIEMEA